MADATREVVVSIKTVPDKGNANTFRQLSDGIRGIQAADVAAVKTLRESIKAEGDRQKALRETIKTQAEATKAGQKGEQERQRTIRETARTQAELDKQQERASKKATSAAKEQERAQASLRRAVEQAGARQQEAQAKFAESAKGALEGVAQLGRGIAMLGLVGEEDTKKLLEGLVKIQAAFDLFKGSITVVQKMGEAMRAYRVATTGAAAAQAALSAAQKAGGGAALAGGVGGKLAAGAAGGIGAGATAGLAVAALASVAVAGKMVVETFKDIGKYGLGGGSSPGTLTGWMGEKQASLGSRLYGATGIDLSAPQNFLTGVAGNKGAFAGAYESGKNLEKAQAEQVARDQMLERQRQQIAIQAERDAAIGELNRGIGERERQSKFRLQGGREEMAFGAAASEAETARGGATSAADRVRELQRQGRTGAELTDAMADAGKAAERLAESEKRRAEEQRNLGLNQDLAGKAVGAAAAERKAAADRVMGLETARKEAIDKGTGGAAEINDKLEVARKQQADAIQREADATGKRLQTERQISQEKLAAVNASIQGAEQEIALRKQAIQTERERLQGAKERFGAMDPMEQQRVAGLLQQARAGQTLSEEDLQTLQGLGLRETDKIAKEQRGKKADQGGWVGLNLGMEEKQRIAEEKQAVGALEVKLKDQRELKVNIERDDRKLANQLAEQVAAMMKERDAQLRALLEEAFKRRMGEVNTQQQATARATQ